MTISELVEWLEDVRKESGDIDVYYASLSHFFKVEPQVRETGAERFILVNP
jgi:hypothetical protein